jgi:tetratricopeptide (TPR) repeat protein/mono/diheme cytochrome c family protein
MNGLNIAPGPGGVKRTCTELYSPLFSRWMAMLKYLCVAAACAWLLMQPTYVAAQTAATPVTFAHDIAPIIFSRCVTCHRPGGDAPFTLTTFDDVRRRASQIAAVTKSGYMPPWKPVAEFGDFRDARRLTDSEIEKIARWVKQDAPFGKAADMPALPTWPSAWPAGEPDLVLRLPSFRLRADGPDVFRNFVVSVPGSGSRLVRGLQFRPGNRAVHHANIRVDGTSASRLLDEADSEPGYEGLILHSADFPDGHFLGWTPGQLAPSLNGDLAWRLDGGNDLVVQLHMRPTGKAEDVSPAIGLYFGGAPSANPPVMLRIGRQSLDIPAGASNHLVSESFVVPVDVDVRAVQPHAHYRARTLDAWATLPDGSRRPLIRILDWDMNWQDRYTYQSPIPLPAGSRITAAYAFDNSDANPRNPDRPPISVGWGWRSSDEMADLWIQVTTRSADARGRLQREARSRMQVEDAVGGEALLLREPNHVALRNDVAMIYMALDQPANALPHFEAVTRLETGSAAAWYNEGVALEALGKTAEAAARYAEAVRLNPAHSGAHNNLGNLWLRDGRVDLARASYEKAVAADRQNAEAHANLAMVQLGQMQPDMALAEVNEALRLQPDRITRLTPFVWLLATHPEPQTRRPDEARQLAERIVTASNRKDPVALDALAAAFAALGRFDDAVRAASEAVAVPQASPALQHAIRDRLALYRAGKPFVLPR